MEKININKKGKIAIAIVCIIIAVSIFLFTFERKKTFNNEEPNSSIAGFYSSSQVYRGGDSREKKNVNINKVEIESQEDQSVIRLKFAYGSESSGMDVANMDAVPEYKIFCLGDPGRIVVKLCNVTFWDYENTFDSANYDAIVKDVFRPYTSTLKEKDSQDVYLFFQVNTDMAYKPSENGDTLEIAVKKVESDLESKAWYVVSSLYYDWEKLIDKVDLYPTYTEDYSKQLLLSKPFNTKQEAESFMNDIKPKLNSLNLEDDLSIKELKRGSLPEYDASADNALFINNNIIKKGNEEKTLPLLMPYGQYLCTSPDGKQMLFAKDVSFVVDDNTNYYVELYLTEISGKATKLNVGEFPSIDKAAFSPDGKKIALLNNTTNYTLEVYNFETNEVINLGEEGIGNMVASFAWDANSNVLHVVAGDNGFFQMKTYDFSKNYGDRIKVLNENSLERDGSFEYSNGKLYYSEQKITDRGYEGTIYKVDESNGNTQEVAKGISFQISPDGKYMAVKDITDYSQFGGEGEFGEGAKIYGLKIIELSNGKETRILENVDVGNFVWSYDSTKLYFAENKQLDNTKETKYIYELNQYIPAQNKREAITLMKTDYFVTTKESNTLLVSDFVNSYYATYILDINNINK